MRVGLVGCTKSKLQHAAPARELYMPSALFRGRRRFVERTCDRWFVLSAKYGVVDELAVLEPYDQTLTTASQDERRAWSERALIDLEARLGDLSGVIFECHAGSVYLDHGLVAGLSSRGAVVERPVDGLTLGQQLAFYARAGGEETAAAQAAVPPRPDLAGFGDPILRIDGPTLNSPAIVTALLSFGETLPASGLIAIGPDPESDELLRSNGFAFLLGVIFDQGIRFERAWRAPLDLKERLGYLDPQRIAAAPEAVQRAVAAPPALHRYINNLPSWIVLAARRVLDDYGGDAERIWNDDPSAEELRHRLQRFQGIGPKKAAMAVEILERQRGIAIHQMSGSDIAFDVHVRRVFLRTGIAERDEQQHMIAAARELHPERPGALDYPAWWIGHEWCRPTEPRCDQCALCDVCPRLVDRASGVVGA